MSISSNLIVGLITTNAVIDIAINCIGEPTTKKVDAIVQPLLNKSDPYHALMDTQKSAEFFSTPRRLAEGGIAVIDVSEGASILINQFSTASNTLSSLSAILTSAQALAVFLTCGIAAAVLSAIDGAWSTFKAIQYTKEINKIEDFITTLDKEMEDIENFLNKEVEILQARRDESIKNIFLAVLIIALFIISNVVSCGLPALIVLGVLAIVITVHKVKNSRAINKKVAKLSQELVSCESDGLYTKAAKQIADLRTNVNNNTTLIDMVGYEIIKGLIIACREEGVLNGFNASWIKTCFKNLHLPEIQ